MPARVVRRSANRSLQSYVPSGRLWIRPRTFGGLCQFSDDGSMRSTFEASEIIAKGTLILSTLLDMLVQGHLDDRGTVA
jgi:hypothetical protein